MSWVLLWSYAAWQGVVQAAVPWAAGTGPDVTGPGVTGLGVSGPAVAAVALLALVLAAALAGAASPRPARAPGLTPPSRRAAAARRLPRLTDPDAAGRPRPRAPGAAPAA
jgi:hypothetical protein